MSDSQRKWCNIEMNQRDAEKFREFLLNYNIKFEVSGCWELIHFEVLINCAERAICTKFINGLYKDAVVEA